MQLGQKILAEFLKKYLKMYTWVIIYDIFLQDNGFVIFIVSLVLLFFLFLTLSVIAVVELMDDLLLHGHSNV